MATTTPDLSTLTSSAQIFSGAHTLPQIRSIHKALHVAVEDKAARLRTQVGSSYRELLGTADAIVRMRAEMDIVQGTLGRMGGRCGRAVVGGKVAGLGKFVKEREDVPDVGAGEGSGLGLVARAKLLEACVLAVARMLKSSGSAKNKIQEDTGPDTPSRGDRLVIAAKVLVLSRLLVKSLGDDITNVQINAAVEASKKSLGNLKRRLLRGIEIVLKQAKEQADREAVLKALCAYSLTDNSGARDVVRHFLRVRGEAMALAFEIEEHEGERSTKDVVKSLGLYTRTLLDVQALVPNKLKEALMGLKKDRLLVDPSLKELEGLRLDIYERWCGDDIQYFKPYIRHDDLDGKQAKEMLMRWATGGGEVLLQGLERTLEKVVDFKAIVEMRTDVLQLWIRDGGKAKGFDPSTMLEKFRTTINAHVVEVLDTKVNKLRLVASEVSATLDAWKEGITDQHLSLWDEDALDIDLSGGANQFTQDVISRLYGRNQAVSKAVNSYRSWYRVIDDVGQIVEQLRRQRWDNDVDEIEDEEVIEQRQQELSREDPQKLHDHLNRSLEKAFQDLDSQFTKLWDAHKDRPDNGHIAMYLVRILRDIRAKLPKLKVVESFGMALVPPLQDKVAQTVIISPMDEFVTSALARKSVIGRSLWEGEPELPTSPSPGVFRFLRDLTIAMGDAGTDLWSPVAVTTMKQHLTKQLSEAWLEALAAHLAKPKSAGPSEEANGHEDAEGNNEPNGKAVSDVTEAERKDLLIQWLYDISLLRCCFSPPAGSSRDEIKGLEEVVYEKTGLDSGPARQRLIKSSQDYWKKTNLLFGLLI